MLFHRNINYSLTSKNRIIQIKIKKNKQSVNLVGRAYVQEIVSKLSQNGEAFQMPKKWSLYFLLFFYFYISF